MTDPTDKPVELPPAGAEHDSASAPAESSPSILPPRVLQADDLFGGLREVLIQNGSDVYRLRRTRSGKLILCK